MNFKNMPKATLVECWHSAVPLKPSHGQTNCLAKKNLPGGKLGILSFPRKNTQKKKRDFIVCFCIYNSLVLLTCKDVHARNACILLVKISQFSLNTLPKQLPDIKIFIKDTSFQICLIGQAIPRMSTTERNVNTGNEAIVTEHQIKIYWTKNVLRFIYPKIGWLSKKMFVQVHFVEVL